jgi:RimJ/RimL family protein N-acetyltransferase
MICPSAIALALRLLIHDECVYVMICFETERLQVRHLTPDDLDDLAALCGDPVAMQYMDDGETLSREVCQKWINICQKKYKTRGYGTSAMVERSSGKFVGFCGVIRAPDHDFDEIIYALSQPYWGKGYATETARAMLDYVFRISDLDAIYATIDLENLTSQSMMPKLNMAFVEDLTEDDGAITRVYVARRPSGGKFR